MSLIATQVVDRLCFDGRGKNCYLPQSVYQARDNCDVVGSKEARSPRRISSSCKGRMERDIYHAIQAHSLIATFTILDFVVRKRQFTNATCVIRITHVLSHCVWLDNHFQYGRRPRSNVWTDGGRGACFLVPYASADRHGMSTHFSSLFCVGHYSAFG